MTIADLAAASLPDIAPPPANDPPTLALWIAAAVAVIALVFLAVRRRRPVGVE